MIIWFIVFLILKGNIGENWIVPNDMFFVRTDVFFKWENQFTCIVSCVSNGPVLVWGRCGRAYRH
jgi:ABC-type cobalamin transport system permease subunit